MTKKKKISHRHLRSVAWELIPLFGPWSRRGLNPIKPVYNPDRPDGRLNLTASAFNQLCQYTSSPGRRGYCYAELAVTSHWLNKDVLFLPARRFAMRGYCYRRVSVIRRYCIETDKDIKLFLGLVAPQLWFSNTTWLRNSNGKGSLSLGWT